MPPRIQGPDVGRRIARLVTTLRETEREIQALTGGQVDAILGSDEGAFLLRGAQEELRKSVAIQRALTTTQAAILDAIPAGIALIDHDGVILAVNEAWRRFGRDNGLRAADSGIGLNYLAVCDRARGEDSEEAPAAAAGIRRVLDGSAGAFSLDYPCHSDRAHRWFRLTATPLDHSARRGAVLMHQEVSEAKFATFAAEQAAEAQADLLAQLALERERLITAQAVAKVGSWETDFRTLETLWSAETYHIFGLDPATFHPTHQTFLERCHPDDRARVDAAFQVSVNTRALRAIEHRIVLPDGSIKQVEERWRIHLDALGSPVRAVGTCQDISESHGIAVAMQEAQTLTRVAATMSKIGGFRTELVSGTRHWSDELCAIYDRAPGDTPSFEEWLVSCAPADRDRVRELYQACVRDGAPYDVELQATTATGRPIWVRIMVEAVRDKAGTIVGTQGAVQDITERIANAAALQENQSLLRVATTLSKVGAFRVLLADGRRRWSDEVCAIYGVPPGYTPDLEEALSFYLPEDRPRMRALFDACWRDGTPYDAELPIVARDGRRGWIRTIGEPVRDASGTVVAVQGAVQDVTERRAVVEALLRSEERFRQTFDSAPVGMVILSIDGRITDANAAFCAMLGYTPEQVRGRSYLELAHPDEATDSFAQFSAIVAGKRPAAVIEKRFVAADGRHGWARISIAAPRDEAGRALYLIAMFADITGEREAQEAVRLSEERFRQTFDSAPMGIAITAADGTFTQANIAFRRMVGRTSEELRGRSFNEITHPDDRTASLAAVTMFLNGRQEPLALEKRYLSADGGTVWARVGIAAPRDAAGKLLYFITVVEDITREHDAQQQLALSEERFRLLSKAANDGIYDWDLDANTVWRNEGFEELYGHGPATLGTTVEEWAELIHPDDRARIITGMRQAIDSGADNWSGEYRFRRKDGRYAHVLDQAHIVHNAEGRAIRMVGANTDLTTRKEGELRLAQQAALLDAAHDAIIVKDMDDRITYWNKGAERSFGWSASEAIGRNAEELFRVERAGYAEARALLLDRGQWEGELIHRGKDGRPRDVSVRWSLVRDEAGYPTAVLAITSDVTERKRLELQFLRAQRLESLGTLAGGIAHDLNNVLAPILVSIELLRMDDDDAERQESLATIEASAKRGAAMVQQVLTFARGAEGKRLPIDITRIAHDVEKIARDTFPKGISIRLNAPPGIWTVNADATQVHQVLMNLCVNARDAMPQGGTLTITLRNASIDEVFARMNPDARRGPYVSIAVADTGVGIPLAVQQRLFEPFFTTKEIGKGTGLGLSTVHSIVHSHRGFIDLYSEMGKGARFTVHLPALVDVTPAPERQGAAVRLPRGNGELVLVVDDEDSIRSIVQRTLERFGYRVLLAANGAEGVAQFVEHRAEIAVIVTDMAMPVMDGPAMIAALFAIDRNVRIVASSGLTSGGSVADALAVGVTQFVSKPYTAETLLTSLFTVLHGGSSGPHLPGDPETPMRTDGTR